MKNEQDKDSVDKAVEQKATTPVKYTEVINTYTVITKDDIILYNPGVVSIRKRIISA